MHIIDLFHRFHKGSVCCESTLFLSSIRLLSCMFSFSALLCTYFALAFNIPVQCVFECVELKHNIYAHGNVVVVAVEFLSSIFRFNGGSISMVWVDKTNDNDTTTTNNKTTLKTIKTCKCKSMAIYID